MGRMSRRDFLVAGAGSVAASALTPGWVGAALAQDGAELTVAWSGSAERARLVNAALDVARTKLVGVNIIADTGSGQQFGSKIQAQLAAGGGPDIYVTQILALADFAAGGAALDLSGYVPKVIDMSAWDNQSIVAAQYRGVQYAISTGFNTFMAMYDPAFTAKAGIEKLDPAWTWTELPTIAKAISQANADVGVFGVNDSSGDLQCFQVYMRSHNVDLFDIQGRFLPTADQIIAYWDYWKQMRDAGACVTPDIQTPFTNSFDAAQLPLVVGKSAIDFDFSNRFTSIQTLANKPLAINTYPKGDVPGMFMRPSLLWMISNHSKAKDKAAALINLLVNDPETGVQLKAQLGAPDNPEIFAQLKGSAPTEDQRVYEYLDMTRTGFLRELQAVVFPKGGSGLSGNFAAQAQAYAFGQSSAQDAASTFLTVVQQSIGA